MKLKKLFYSKKFLFFNLVLVGIILGFVIAMLSFSCSTGIASDKTAYAEDKPITSLEDLEDIQNSFRGVAKRVLPTVVQIRVVEVAKQTVPEGDDFPFFPWNFGPSEPDDSLPKEHEFRNQGIGSGVIVRKNGKEIYVLTNNHVIGEADEIELTLYDDREFEATLVGTDNRKDLALLKFESRDDSIPVATIGDSSSLYVGDWVLAIGNPFGYDSTVTAGIVSAKGRRGPTENISDFIQTDAAINQGNSGGALVNIRGELVGINTWITTPTGGSIGLGFAIPINNAKKAINDFIEYGKVEYGWLGVSIGDPLASVAKQMNIEGKNGAFIYHVFEGSPADKGGMLPGDYITSIEGKKIKDANMLVQTVGDLEAGETVHFELIRYGEPSSLDITIGLRADARTISSKNKNLWPGLSVIPLTQDFRKQLDLPSSLDGLLVREIEPRTKLDVAGIKLGDIITRINDTKLKTVMDFYRVINNENADELRFHFVREDNEYNIAIER
jgi:Do/DeqQ family serine protease